jgi:hypothetical protein
MRDRFGRFVKDWGHKKQAEKPVQSASASQPTSTRVQALLKRNPDLLTIGCHVFDSIPAIATMIEDAEITLLRQNIATSNLLYLENRGDLLAIYTRLGFTRAQNIVAKDILQQ